VSRSFRLKALFLALLFLGFGGTANVHAQDWTDFLHWPYVPPQVPGNGFEYNGLYDGWYRYPREQRIVPQIQGPLYRNYYGGQRLFGLFRVPNGWWNAQAGWFDQNNMRYYSGHHFYLDVF
jgi:hypothetical protein